MKKTLKSFSLILLGLVILNTSCRSEESELIQSPQEETLEANSKVANLMQRVAQNDGSDDNIIDNANCLDIELPVTVTVNGLELTIDSEGDLELIEDIFDEFEDDIDELEILFPITITLPDFTDVTLNNFEELEQLASECAGENEDDDDIECVDIQYPITATLFDINDELIGDLTINNDEELYLFIEDLDDADIVNIGFPITVVLSDGSEVEVTSLDELEDVLEDAEDDCDEDDDYDYNDDDCEFCSVELLTEALTACPVLLSELERNDMVEYEGYLFSFDEEGNVSATDGFNTFEGSWSAEGSGFNLVMTLDMPDLAAFSGEWLVREIEVEGTESEVELEMGEDDELEFESSCDS